MIMNVPPSDSFLRQQTSADGMLICSKSATRGVLKNYRNRFRPELRPGSHWGAHDALPEPLVSWEGIPPS